MKTLFLSVGVILTIALSSCGGGNDAAADAEKLCSCYKEATIDMTKMGDCEKLVDEMKAKYKEGTEEYKIVDERMEKCEQENESDGDGD